LRIHGWFTWLIDEVNLRLNYFSSTFTPSLRKSGFSSQIL